MELQTSWISSRAAGVLKKHNQFRIKAIFDQVINLEAEQALIAVQTDKAALTPLTVQVNGRQLTELAASAYCQGIELTANISGTADCRLPVSELTPDYRWVKGLSKLISVLAKPDSLAFAVVPLWNTLPHPTGVQRKARSILMDSEKHLATGNFADAVKSLNGLGGLGPGLTPAGDDFLVGVLAVCHRFPHSNIGRLRKKLGEDMRRSLSGCAWLSAALLKCALEGEFSPSIHNIFLAHDEQLVCAVAAGATWGHTSGSDTLGGILWALYMSIS